MAGFRSGFFENFCGGELFCSLLNIERGLASSHRRRRVSRSFGGDAFKEEDDVCRPDARLLLDPSCVKKFSIT